jgi:hypothetical protein
MGAPNEQAHECSCDGSQRALTCWANATRAAHTGEPTPRGARGPRSPRATHSSSGASVCRNASAPSTDNSSRAAGTGGRSTPAEANRPPRASSGLLSAALASPRAAATIGSAAGGPAGVAALAPDGEAAAPSADDVVVAVVVVVVVVEELALPLSALTRSATSTEGPVQLSCMNRCSDATPTARASRFPASPPEATNAAALSDTPISIMAGAHVSGAAFPLLPDSFPFPSSDGDASCPPLAEGGDGGARRRVRATGDLSTSA